MAIWILQNQYQSIVLQDLYTICPDPGLTIDRAGKITYRQTMSNVGCNMLAGLQQLGTVIIRGENSNWSPGITPKEREKGEEEPLLSDIAGIAVCDQYPNTQIVEIVYDATGCNGKGFFTFDLRGVIIDLPSDVLLFHELAHAAEMLIGQHDPDNPEPGAIEFENLYRSARNLPLRGSHDGGCTGDTSNDTTPSPNPGETENNLTPGIGKPGALPSIHSPIILSSPQVPAPICTPLLTLIPQGIGTNHVITANQIKPAVRSYVVAVTNLTQDTFTQIVVFYKRIGLRGVVFLKNEIVAPGQFSSFLCGLCKDLESYVIGFFIGDDLVFQFPSQGNMTPELAGQIKPSDSDPCIDSWTIE